MLQIVTEFIWRGKNFGVRWKFEISSLLTAYYNIETADAVYKFLTFMFSVNDEKRNVKGYLHFFCVIDNKIRALLE